jgi:hypothetical protein
VVGVVDGYSVGTAVGMVVGNEVGVLAGVVDGYSVGIANQYEYIYINVHTGKSKSFTA